MEIWLSNGNEDKLLIPVNPESIKSSDERNFEDIVLADGDERTVISGRSLRTYSISSFFPTFMPHYANEHESLSSPMDYVKKIKDWMDNKKVLLLQVTTTVINEQVTIRSFEWEERGGAVGDIEYTIELKEYRPITYEKMTIAATATTRPNSIKEQPKTYIVKSGDTLSIIAQKIYGNSTFWGAIYDKNKVIIGPNPNLIKPGQVLTIPEKGYATSNTPQTTAKKPAPTQPTIPPNRDYIYKGVYRVEKGDTHFTIAMKVYGTTKYAYDLMSYNAIPSPFILAPGRPLNLPASLQIYQRTKNK